MLLDEGEEMALSAGDILVQRVLASTELAVRVKGLNKLAYILKKN